MALRLSNPGTAPEQPQRRAERLTARAQASLLARDFKGYRALFEETAEIEDIHRRQPFPIEPRHQVCDGVPRATAHPPRRLGV